MRSNGDEEDVQEWAYLYALQVELFSKYFHLVLCQSSFLIFVKEVFEAIVDQDWTKALVEQADEYLVFFAIQEISVVIWCLPISFATKFDLNCLSNTASYDYIYNVDCHCRYDDRSFHEKPCCKNSLRRVHVIPRGTCSEQWEHSREIEEFRQHGQHLNSLLECFSSIWNVVLGC